MKDLPQGTTHSDRWTDEGIGKAVKESFERPIINGSFDIYQRPQHWMEKMWITRIVFKLYHKVRNWFITL